MEKLQIVAVSNWLKDVVAQSFLGNYPIETIENGVDLHRFYPELNTMKNQLGIQNVMVLCVANVWSPQKGLADILEMARHARSNMTFVIVGLNERQNKSLPPDVVGFGKISEEQTLRTLYSAADVCVNPSRSETFGMVPLEALACGTPVIVYDVTGCSGIVDDSCGAKVPLASGWQGLLDAAMRYANWKPDCCRQRARQFDEDRCLQAYQALYMRLKNG